VRLWRAAELAGLALSESARPAAEPAPAVNAGAGSFKSQFKKADKSGALYALILGDDELAQQVIGFKPLRGQGEQQNIAWDALAAPGHLRRAGLKLSNSRISD
jgi:histidyl-tRNA synthetase